MIDITKNYWFLIYPHIYVAKKEDKILLYNTQNGKSIEFHSQICVELIDCVYDPVNLGVVLLEKKFTSANSGCVDFIQTIIEEDIGTIIEFDDSKVKPVNLLPILNLQSDIDKLVKHDIPLDGENLIKYLTGLTIYLNDKCDKSCIFCNQYCKQTESCTCGDGYTFLFTNGIDNLLLQSTLSSINTINITGGNILTYPYWKELMKIVEKYDYDFHYWIHYLNFKTGDNWLGKDKQLKKEILINFPIEEDIIRLSLSKYNVPRI